MHVIPVFRRRRQENYYRSEGSLRLVYRETDENKEGEGNHPIPYHFAGKFRFL